MFDRAKKLRKKYRYKPNYVFLLGCQFIIMFFGCLLLGGYSRFGKTNFTVSNYSDTKEKIECLIVIDQDTMLYRTLEPRSVYNFSNSIPKGKYLMTIYNPLQGVMTVDSLWIRDQYHNEYVYIRYRYLNEIDAIGKNMVRHGHEYQKLAKHMLFHPINRNFEIVRYQSDFFSFLWEVYY